MKGKIITNLVIVIALVVTTFTMGLGENNYSYANSGYPEDIVGTPLLIQAWAFIDRGVITGDTDGLFHPERNITRAEYATIMTKVLNRTSSIPSAEKQKYFGDLSGYGWAKGYINVCYEAGLVNGISKSKYNPGGSVTYVEVIAVILRSRGITDATIGSYEKWPNNYIRYAEMYGMAGLMNIPNWNAPASKGDVVQLLYRNMPKSTASSANVSVTTNPSPALSTSGAVFTANVTGTGTHSYQWYFNDGPIVGETNSSYTTTGTTSVGAFHVRVTTDRSGYAPGVADSGKITVQ